MNKKFQAQIGIFGGSSFYDFLKNGRQIKIKTPFGWPSDKIFIGNYKGKKIAFLARHGQHHQYPPHKIPYRANLYAFKMLGVKQIIAPVASGSLKAKIKPGDFVICDQFVDKTYGRETTYFEGPQTKNKFSKAKTVHISSVEPYCSYLRKLAIKACQRLKIRVHNKGTIVVINGPRFSTRAESEFYQRQGWDVINMTQYPECILAKELEMCYLNISLITDYDAGLKGNKNVKAVSFEEIRRVFKQNNEKVKKLIFEIIEKMPENLTCNCHQSFKNAVVS